MATLMLPHQVLAVTHTPPPFCGLFTKWGCWSTALLQMQKRKVQLLSQQPPYSTSALTKFKLLERVASRREATRSGKTAVW